jgi:threonine aldolase
MHAPVGDDVYKEDPSVNKLEKRVAAMFNMDEALFFPTGTMANQAAIKLHTQPGEQLIADKYAHVYNYEGGGISFNSGVQAKLLLGNEGRLSAELIEPAINGDFDWLTKTSLVALENTVNRAGGSYYTINQIKPIQALCKKHNLKLHLDGARIFNAIVESNETPKQIGECFDSISICLSKGLGAPVGSVLLGEKEFIKKARRIRKVFGGGMRQAGILAGAGLYALNNNVTRLKEDHTRAKKLEQELLKLSYIDSVLPVYTNIVIFNLKADIITGEAFEKKLFEKNIKIAAFGKHTIRMVTHLDFDDAMLAKTIEVLKGI